MPYPARIHTLKAEAKAAARARGHLLTAFLHQHTGTPQHTAGAVCRRCSADVTVTLSPAPNGVDIGGTAVALNCALRNVKPVTARLLRGRS